MTVRKPEQTTMRPRKPAPLDPRSEASRAAWRQYLRACARADSALMSAKPDRRNPLAQRLN